MFNVYLYVLLGAALGGGVIGNVMITGIKKRTLLVCLKRSSLSEKICLYFQVVFVQGENR